MKINLAFEFARIFDVKKFQVVVGEQFTVKTDFAGDLSYFSNNDPVLQIKQNSANNGAAIVATEMGSCLILLKDPAQDLATVGELEIEVVDAIAEQAVDLNATAGTPIPKT